VWPFGQIFDRGSRHAATGKKMNEEDRSIILELKKRLPDTVKERIRKVVAFGSRARGEDSEDSDLDLLILVDRKAPEIEGKIEDIAYQVMWDHDFKPILSIKLFTESSYHDRVREGFSFYTNIEREGVPL
jgi:predicted nucleotidyltransferase